ncbi:MAG: hypothetical protein ACTS10_21865 [Kiloniellales bacterium]
MQNSPKLDQPKRELAEVRQQVGFLPLYERDGVLVAEGHAHARVQDAYEEILNDPLPGTEYVGLLVHYDDGSVIVDRTDIDTIRAEIGQAQRDERAHDRSLLVAS